MKLQPIPVLVAALLALPLTGCCFFYPEWSECANPPNPVSFKVIFYNTEVGLCGEEFDRRWRVTYQNTAGNPITEPGVPVGAPHNQEVWPHNAADNDEDGFIDGEVEIRIYVGCDPNQPEEGLGWSLKVYEDSLPVNVAVLIELKSDGTLEYTQTPGAGARPAAKVLFTVNKLTGMKIEPEKPIPDPTVPARQSNLR